MVRRGFTMFAWSAWLIAITPKNLCKAIASNNQWILSEIIRLANWWLCNLQSRSRHHQRKRWVSSDAAQCYCVGQRSWKARTKSNIWSCRYYRRCWVKATERFRYVIAQKGQCSLRPTVPNEVDLKFYCSCDNLRHPVTHLQGWSNRCPQLYLKDARQNLVLDGNYWSNDWRNN